MEGTESLLTMRLQPEAPAGPRVGGVRGARGGSAALGHELVDLAWGPIRSTREPEGGAAHSSGSG